MRFGRAFGRGTGSRRLTCAFRAVLAAALGAAGLALAGQPALAQQGYYIVMTPSGVPYTVPLGTPPPGPAIWPYQEQFAPMAAVPPPAPPGTQPGGRAGATGPVPLELPPTPPSTPPPSLAEPSPPAPEIAPPPQPRPLTPEPGTAGAGDDEAAPATAEAAGPKRYKDGIYVIDNDFLLSVPQNAWRIVSAPVNFDTEDWLITAGVVGAAGLALVADQAISDFWQDDIRSSAGDDVLDTLENLGTWQYVAAASLGGYAVAEAFDAPREKAAALMTLESLMFANALSYGVKYVTGRERPTDTDDQYAFFQRTENRGNSSFFSGHATTAFTTATVLSEVYGPDNPWVPYVAYPLATGVSLARLNKDRHWLSDLVVAGAVGHFVAKMVTRYNPFLEEQGIAIKPVTIGETPGVGFTYAY